MKKKIINKLINLKKKTNNLHTYQRRNKRISTSIFSPVDFTTIDKRFILL